MSSGLKFDEIIMNMIRKKALECQMETVGCYFTIIVNKRIYIYRRSLQDFYLKKGTHESLDVECLYFNVKKIKMRQNLTNILKCDTSSDDMKEKIDHWLDYFKSLTKLYYYAYRIMQFFIS